MEHTFLDKDTKVNSMVSRYGTKWLASKHSTVILGVISFAESVFAPIVIDPFLIAMILASPKKWKQYTLVSIVASVAGGIFAYLLGALFFEALGTKIISFYSLEDTFSNISIQLNDNAFVFVLLGALTPIPYKLVALASGLLKISFFTFIVASLIGRILRLGLVGIAASKVGPKALPMVRRNLYTIAAVIGVILCLYIAVKLFW